VGFAQHDVVRLLHALHVFRLFGGIEMEDTGVFAKTKHGAEKLFAPVLGD